MALPHPQPRRERHDAVDRVQRERPYRRFPRVGRSVCRRKWQRNLGWCARITSWLASFTPPIVGGTPGEWVTGWNQKLKVGVFINGAGIWIARFGGSGMLRPVEFYPAFGGLRRYCPGTGDWNGNGRTEGRCLLRGKSFLDMNGNGTPGMVR